MRKILTILSLICFTACNETEIAPDVEQIASDFRIEKVTKSADPISDEFDIRDYPYSIEEDSLYIEEINGKITSIIDNGDYYIVNNEFIFTKEELFERRKQPTPRLYGHVLHKECQQIFIYTEVGYDNFGAYYQNDLNILKEAIAEWNSIADCNIYFASIHDSTYMYNPENWIDIKIYLDDDMSHLFGNLPTGTHYIWGHAVDGMPWLNTWINVGHQEYCNFSDETKKHLMMHILGHIIDLKDTDSETDWIPETEGTGDIFSIMYSYEYLTTYCGMEWSGFSRTDLEDLKKIYPLIPKSIDFHLHPSNAPTNELKTNENYVFIAEIDTIKELTDCSWEYSVTKGNEHFCSQIGEQLNISFDDPGTYTISLTLTLSNGDTMNCSKEYTVIREITYPTANEIHIGQEFIIDWTCSSSEHVSFSGIETTFDKNDDNIIIENIGRGTASICIQDYGSYTITMTKYNASNTVLETKKICIDKYYHPTLYYPNTTNSEYGIDFRQNLFEVGRECPEDVSDMTITGTNPEYSIIVNDGDPISSRLYVRIYEKFYRDAFIPPFRVDRGPVTVTSTYSERKYQAGTSVVINLPKGRNGYKEVRQPGWLNYMGYYAVVIPENHVYLLEN